MRDPEYVAALFENILEHISDLINQAAGYSVNCGYVYDDFDKYPLIRKRIIDLMVEIELGNTPDWDQINGILPTLEG